MKEYTGSDVDSTLENEEHYLKKELYALIKGESLIFDFLQEAATDGLWFWDLNDPDNEWMSPKFWITLGYDPNKKPHKSSAWQDIIFEEDLKLVYANFAKHSKDPSYPYDQIVRYKHKLGHTVWIRCRGLIIRDENRKPTRMLGTHFDITKIKKTKKRLFRQINYFQHIIDGTDLGTWQWNVQTGEIIFNERWAEIIGYTLTELYPLSIDTWNKNTHPEDLKKSNKLLQDHFDKVTSVYECEARMKHKNGEYVWILDKGKVVSWDSEGKPEWMIGSHQEITKLKKAFEKNRLFIEQAPTAIAMFDTNMCYLATSLKWFETYNIKDKDIIGKSHYDVFPEINDKWKADHQEGLKGKVLKSDEYRFERLDGSVQWLTWELRPWYTDDDKIGGVIIYTADITRIKEVETRLRMSEEVFRRNFENAAIGMAMMDDKGGFTKVNYQLCNMLGYTSSELTNMSFTDIIHSDDIKLSHDLYKMHFKGERLYSNAEKKCIHKNGEIVYVNFSTSIIKDENGAPAYCIAQILDISHKIVARQKLEEAITKLENIIDDITKVSIIGADKSGVITTFNRGAENLLGYTKEEVMFKKPFEILFNADELKEREKELSILLNRPVKGFEVFICANEKEYETKEWTHMRKDGTGFPVQLTVSTIKENDEIIGYLSVATDISEIKKAEKELKSLLEVAEDQNRRLKNFAHIVSHNLKSHSGNFEMLLDLYIQENPEIENNEIMQLFRTASKNLSETISHLNEVVSINTSLEQNLVPIHLKKAIDEVVQSISAIALESNVSIENEVDTDIQVMAIPAYLDSILLNFITNGIKYHSPKRDSYVKLRASIKREEVELSIEDNGLGIDLNKHGAKLFGMYKTFHPNIEKSRGIGLFITKNQVEAIDGRIEVESKVDFGTTFKIYMQYEKN
ncbi:PAS domain S-box protein [Aquimarina pacifica]|uniref:PAS domain S-box protein n=1 Tax=Aquimarina pacifica TaxID=1296415 RepID=UPI000471A9B0|nr:PAS domain S-box protein [Aquimarina pacifica]